MAKMHFKYASMNSGKSIDLIRTAYNYEENGFKVLITKPKIDTKTGKNISSRIGIERKVDYLIDKDDSIIELFKNNLNDINCIFVDEAQFLTEKQIDDLYLITKALEIPVICYGLRTNFMMNSFEGSKRLLEISDELEELPTLCSCGQVARFNSRMKNGVLENIGQEVIIDGEENYEYIPVCGKCYLEKVKKINLNDINKNLIKK